MYTHCITTMQHFKEGHILKYHEKYTVVWPPWLFAHSFICPATFFSVVVCCRPIPTQLLMQLLLSWSSVWPPIWVGLCLTGGSLRGDLPNPSMGKLFDRVKLHLHVWDRRECPLPNKHRSHLALALSLSIIHSLAFTQIHIIFPLMFILSLCFSLPWTLLSPSCSEDLAVWGDALLLSQVSRH